MTTQKPRKARKGKSKEPVVADVRKEEAPVAAPPNPNGVLQWGAPQIEENVKGVCTSAAWVTTCGRYRVVRHVPFYDTGGYGPRFVPMAHSESRDRSGRLNGLVWMGIVLQNPERPLQYSATVPGCPTLEEAIGVCQAWHCQQTKVIHVESNVAEIINDAASKHRGLHILPRLLAPTPLTASGAMPLVAPPRMPGGGGKPRQSNLPRDAFGSREGTLEWKVNRALSKEPKSMRELMAIAQVTGTVYNHMKKLVESGKVLKNDQGKYHLR